MRTKAVSRVKFDTRPSTYIYVYYEYYICIYNPTNDILYITASRSEGGGR